MLKTKFIFIYLILFFILSFTIINCSDDSVSPAPVDSSDFRYPFKDGSTWTYKRTLSVSDIRPDSILYYFNEYPLTATGTVTILYDTVINSVTTKCFLDEFTLQGVLRSNRFYYVNNDTSLFLYYARFHPATGLFPLNIVKSSNYPSADKIKFTLKHENTSSYFTDTVFSILKYPVISGKEWSYSNGFVTILKKYTGFENINFQAGTISCMKTTTAYSYLPNNPVINYYSKYGLMKRTWYQDDIVFSTMKNPDGIGTIDTNDDSEILSYNIPFD